MPDDDPLDDARAVATAAAAAAARVAETVARHVSETTARQLAALERAHDQQVAKEVLGKVGETVEPKREQGYDTTEQRGRRDAAREEAGVTLETRRVVAIADQINGQDPALVATVGRAQNTRTRPASPVQDRARGR